MNSTKFGGIFRHLLTAAGGALVAGGIVQPDVGAGITDIATGITDAASDPITRQEVIGAVVTIVGFFWSWKDKENRA